ncbi:hypothetical protein K461DRAFT_292734 [Myriangium duriaei CBS 260.36]|uniref:Homeobox domain-containing protein n=1 Tax=Myriangium duriaei CBS 260.36 TaxID=1168546 RepID=A0A9P4J236_9PEZI|nr:hypothetical protein K461DRAFT_292734 [Myriangium duriaei CBS 260.36]
MSALQDENTPPTTTSQTNIAFIVHDPATLTNNLPPNVDNKPLARQKRRRTSPEDQIILEREYQRNSKPDKAARMAIVERVALGEKEVQIWFQNRRQASRRKSKPLELHEIAQYQSLRSGQQPGQQSSRFPPSSVHGSDATPTQPLDSTQDDQASPSPSQSAHQAQRKLPPPFASTPRTSSTMTPHADITPSQPPSSSQDRERLPHAYLADLRNETPRSSQEGQDASPSTVASQESPAMVKPQRDSLRRTSSNVRLSMSFDGNAKIITKDDSSPSPPRQRPSPAQLPRYPAKTETDDTPSIGEGEEDGLRQKRPAALARKPSGRSRDSRAWEYWADKDARSELEEKANQETSGSAADAIGLLRSASSRSILGVLTNKRPSAYEGNQSAKRSKRTPLLQRSQSMQNRQSPTWMNRMGKGDKSPRKFKKAQSGLGIQMMAADSDKENWSPERQISQVDGVDSPDHSDDEDIEPRRTTVTPGKTLLAGVEHHAQLSSSSDPEDDEEIARFMSSKSSRPRERERERKSNSVSEEEELDCVQGLLSLSQGNWR